MMDTLNQEIRPIPKIWEGVDKNTLVQLGVEDPTGRHPIVSAKDVLLNIIPTYDLERTNSKGQKITEIRYDFDLFRDRLASLHIGPGLNKLKELYEGSKPYLAQLQNREKNGEDLFNQEKITLKAYGDLFSFIKEKIEESKQPKSATKRLLEQIKK